MLNVLCVVPLSQPCSRDLLYVKCLCVLSRYLRPIVEICYMLNVCVLSRYRSPVVEICYMLTMCRDLHYPFWDFHIPEIK